MNNGEPQLDHTDRLAIVLIVVLAAIPRLLLLLSLPPLVHLDSDSYFEIARRIWSGGGLGDLSRRTPLYPLLLAMAGHFRAGLFPVVLIQHLLGAVSAVVCYLIGRRLFPPRFRWAATASGILAGVVIYPAVLEHSILSESLFSFLLLAAVWLLLVWCDENQTWAALACGATLGLAALTRPIGAGLFFVVAGLLFPLRGGKRAFRFLSLGGTAFALLLFPLLLRNYRAMDSFSLTESLGRNLISVTDRLVDYDRGAELPIKSIYREFLKDKRGPDAVVVYSAMPRLRAATGWSDAQIDRSLARIAWEAIRAHPLEYLSDRLRRLPLLFRDPEPSQWYALHAETYLPLLEFAGRIDPEMVSRSVSVRTLKNARFDLVAIAYKIFALDFTSGWLFVFSLAGMVWILRRERRRAGWLLVAILLYLWIGTILLQSPNARYRIPTLPFEFLFAAGGICFAAEVLAGIAKRAPKTKSAEAPDSVSSARGVWAALIVIVLIVAVRTAMALEAKPVFDLTGFKANERTSESSGPGESDSLPVRELPMAGRKLSVLYWNGTSGLAAKTISANVTATGGLFYRVQAAYSCATRECAGALLSLTFLDSRGSLLGSSISLPLAQERIDNDLFWDQLDRCVAIPKSAQSMRVDLAVQPGKGNLVVPYFVIRAFPTPISF